MGRVTVTGRGGGRSRGCASNSRSREGRKAEGPEVVGTGDSLSVGKGTGWTFDPPKGDGLPLGVWIGPGVRGRRPGDGGEGRRGVGGSESVRPEGVEECTLDERTEVLQRPR